MSYGLITIGEQEQVVRALRGWHWLRKNHGSLYQRGAADSYYHRGPRPHYYADGHWSSRVDVSDDASVKEYMAGYEDNEQYGDKKDYG